MISWQPESLLASVPRTTLARTLRRAEVWAAILVATLSGVVAAEPGRGISVNDQSGVEREVFAYFADFGNGDVDAILTHYADDAVFMPSGLPTVAGKDSIRAAYVETLKHVRIQPGGQSVAEDAFISGEFAWVRTDSRAEALNPTTGETTQGHFREVFLLRKDDGQWKIWRYMFNTIEAPPQGSAARAAGPD